MGVHNWCCVQLSDVNKTRKCFCGKSPKSTVYIAGAIILVICAYVEARTIGSIVYIFDNDYDANKSNLTLYLQQVSVIGSGVGVVHHAVRNQDDFETSGKNIGFVRDLLIAWAVINGLLFISTCLMIIGTVKDQTKLLLQWLIISATITIGNVIDIIIAIIYMLSNPALEKDYYPGSRRSDIYELVQCFVEIVAISFVFILVRNYYAWTNLPSIPTSFKVLEGQESQYEREETG